jgi:arabinofuranosyltransferase
MGTAVRTAESRRSNDRATLIVSIGIALLVISLVRTAWLSDDAYITFRTADNIIHGFGPVWNVDERVQTYTHPLWLALCTPAFWLTGEVFFTAIALGAVCTLVAVALIATRLASTPWNFVVCLAALLSSKAFIDFSTSGLENPLTHLLLLYFLWLWWREPDGTRRMRRLSFTAALCLMTRLDLAPLVLPALACEGWRLGLRAAIRPLFVGILPLIGWEMFSIFYYGSLVPNTAYAKLNTVMTADIRLRHGLAYLSRTLTSDPVTLPVIASAAFALFVRRGRDWPIVAGIGLFMLYVVQEGGDWMMGRFLTPAFVLSVGLLARAEWLQSRRPSLLTATMTLVVGLFASWEPAILSGYGYSRANNLLHGRRTMKPLDDEAKTFGQGVMDERRYYSEATGLLKSFGRGLPRPNYEWSVEGLRLRASDERVVVRSNIGMLGYFAGPDVHVIDSLALGDPLLARLPGGTLSSPMGHFPRAIPDGYVETIATGTNHLADRDLAAYYDRLHEIISGPLWSARRLRMLPLFLAGRYDAMLNAYIVRRNSYSVNVPSR